MCIRDRPAATRKTKELLIGRASVNGLPQPLVKTQHLEDPLSPQIAGVPAFFTAHRTVQRLLLFKGEKRTLSLGCRTGFPARCV